MPSNLLTATVKSAVKILCYYTNSTPKIQIIRVTNTKKLNLEKVIFPQQRILFEATAEEQLEIHTSQAGAKKIAQIIPCQNLRADRVEPRNTTNNIMSQQDKSA